MYKIITIILLTCCGFSLMALQGKDNIDKKIQQVSKNSIYQSTLDCKHPLSTGSFQYCNFKLHKKDNLVKNTQIFMSGGMPGHDHGLPTLPQISWSENEQTYVIKGLKFSMPGKWILNFKINASEVADKDMISMAVTVN